MTGLAGRTVLLTGGSGVLGTALAARLTGCHLICLVRKNPVPGATESVPADVTEPRFGLADGDYRRLAARVDAVVHSAAVTDFLADPDLIAATNVTGVSHVVEFARDAGAPLYHLSTAFLGSSQRSGMNSSALAYADSKRAGERVIRESGVPHLILRPSIVIGDTDTGVITRFQAIYYVASATLAGWLPVIPFGQDWLVDYVPRDLVAEIVVRLLEREIIGIHEPGPARPDPDGALWLTAGPVAPTVRATIDQIRATAPRFGRPEPASPKYVAPDMYQRLIAPVFLPSLPGAMRKTVTRLFDSISPYLLGTEPYPSDLARLCQLLNLPPVPDPGEAFARSLDYWAMKTIYAGSRRAGVTVGPERHDAAG